jgi:hypothetical protein
VGENALRISELGNPEDVEIELKLGERGWAHEWSAGPMFPGIIIQDVVLGFTSLWAYGRALSISNCREKQMNQ